MAPRSGQAWDTGGKMAEQDMAKEHALAEGATFTWHELYVPDGEAGVKFYTEVCKAIATL